MLKKDILLKIGAAAGTFALGVAFTLGGEFMQKQFISTCFKKSPEPETEDESDEDDDEEEETED